jgi:hypothetical protein
MARWQDLRAEIRPDVMAQLTLAGASETKLSDDTCAALACLVYKNELNTLKTGLPTGWKYLEQAPQAKGYDASALHHVKSKTLVILNRGTEFPNSIDDIVQNVAAIVTGEDYGQIEAALDFLVAMWTKYAGARVVEIKAIGHSLGGGLAEAQTFLGGDAIRKAGDDPPANLYGYGVGSAGYEDAIRQFADEKGLVLHNDITDITHLVRPTDFTQTIGLEKRIGGEKFVAGIFEPRWGEAIGPKGRRRWSPEAATIQSHDPFLYFKHRNISARNQHLMWRWLSSKDHELRDGAAPRPYSGGQLPPEDR